MESARFSYKKSVLAILIMFFCIGLFGCTIENGLKSDDYGIFISNAYIEEKVDKVKSSEGYVVADEIASNFLDALVAVEDNRFYKHGGIDFKAIIRSVVANVRAKSVVQGGSTITQQLAKNLFLNGNQDVSRKIREIVIARKLEKLYSKEKILELYANIVYYGNGYYGINNASYGYFNSAPKNLTLNQGSLLAGLLQAPNSYNPKKHLNKAKARQQEVLDAMLQYGYITKEQMESVLSKGN